MDNSKFFKTVIIILLLINIGTLAFMWFGNSHHGPPPPPNGRGDAMHFLTNELKLSDEQQKQFEELRNKREDEVEPLQKNGRRLHDSYFEMLGIEGTDSAVVVQMADSMVANQKQIELITYYHFKSVREICTPGQQKKFDKIIADALGQMAQRPPRGRR